MPDRRQDILVAAVAVLREHPPVSTNRELFAI